MFKFNKKKDLPKQYYVYSYDFQNQDNKIEKSGEDGFVTFADACNWAFNNVPSTYHITIKCGEIPVFEVCLFGLKGEILNENGRSD